MYIRIYVVQVFGFLVLTVCAVCVCSDLPPLTDMLHDEMESVEGNATRDLWKLCTWQLASDVSCSI